LQLIAYFAFGLILSQGIAWDIALGICFWSAVILLVFNSFGWREMLFNSIPHSLRYATAGGIGLFLIFIGFQNICLVMPSEATLVCMGDATSPQVYLTFLGIILITVLLVRNIAGAFLWVIFFLSIIGWVFGLQPFEGILALPALPKATFFQLDLVNSLHPKMWPYIFTFVFIGLIDAVGTIIALGQQGAFLVENRLPSASKVLGCDGIGTLATSIFGSSPITTYLESGAGIAAGGRTGLTAIVVSFLFLTALFFRPLIESVPLFATTPALIIVGVMMTECLKKVQWDDPTEAIPSCMTLAAIPLTYSVASGLAIGFISYPVIKFLSGQGNQVSWILWVTAFLFALKFALA
jgi:AGZA family xanthine/uracil permease-like MFS transporter